MFTMGPIHTQDHGPGCSGADLEPAARQTGGGFYCMPIQDMEPTLPSDTWMPSGRSESFNCTI